MRKTFLISALFSESGYKNSIIGIEKQMRVIILKIKIINHTLTQTEIFQACLARRLYGNYR